MQGFGHQWRQRLCFSSSNRNLHPCLGGTQNPLNKAVSWPTALLREWAAPDAHPELHRSWAPKILSTRSGDRAQGKGAVGGTCSHCHTGAEEGCELQRIRMHGQHCEGWWPGPGPRDTHFWSCWQPLLMPPASRWCTGQSCPGPCFLPPVLLQPQGVFFLFLAIAGRLWAKPSPPPPLPMRQMLAGAPCTPPMLWLVLPALAPMSTFLLGAAIVMCSPSSSCSLGLGGLL